MIFPRRKRRHKVLIWIFVLLILGTFSMAWLSLSPSVSGIYIVEGGTGAVHIRRTGHGLKVVEGYGEFSDGHWSGSTLGNGLKLDRTHEGRALSRPQQMLRFELSTSLLVDGDYDLRYVDQTVDKWFMRMIATLVPDSEYERQILGRDYVRGSPSHPPVVQYLHKVDDPQVLEFFRLKNGLKPDLAPGWSVVGDTYVSSDAARLVTIAEQLVKRYPEDLIVRSLLLEALIRADDVETLEEKIALWCDDYTQSSTSAHLAYRGFRLAENHLVGWKRDVRHSNLFPLIVQILSPETNLQTRLALSEKISRHTMLIPPQTNTISSRRPVMNFLEAQTFGKCLQAASLLRATRSQPESGFTLAVAGHHFGQLLMNYDERLITKLIAIALKAMHTETLAIFILNANESVDDLDKQWSQLEILNRFELLKERSGMHDEMNLSLPTLIDQTPNFLEAFTRYDSAIAKFQMVRTAAAVRRIVLETGDFPETSSGLLTNITLPPLLPDGPPADVFDPTTAPLRLLYDAPKDAMLVYSIGPDSKDQNASFQYDPSNGTKSSGDIILTIPRHREYPFTSVPLESVTSATVAAQFPNGLPEDIFARVDNRTARLPGTYVSVNTRGYNPLRLEETSGTLYLLSVGPDLESDFLSETGDGHSIMYDPTNGTTSSGDIFTLLSGNATLE